MSSRQEIPRYNFWNTAMMTAMLNDGGIGIFD